MQQPQQQLGTYCQVTAGILRHLLPLRLGMAAQQSRPHLQVQWVDAWAQQQVTKSAAVTAAAVKMSPCQ
jgi:hypothetical protein